MRLGVRLRYRLRFEVEHSDNRNIHIDVYRVLVEAKSTPG